MDGPLVVAVSNMKGGVGKTSTCHHATEPLVAMGNRVLLVDMDPQANLTKGLGLMDEAGGALELPHHKTSLALFDERLMPDPAELIWDTPIAGLKIVPACWSLRKFDLPEPTSQGDLQVALRMFLQEVADDFDVVLIDCRPTLELLTWNAYLAAEFVVVPFQPEDYGAQGIIHVQQAIDEAIEGYNPRIRLLGYLLTKVQRRAIHQAYATTLSLQFPGDVFKTQIPDAKDFPEAVSARVPVGHYKKRSKAARVMRTWVGEMLERVPVIRKATPRYLYPGNHMRTDMNVTLPEQELGKAG